MNKKNIPLYTLAIILFVILAFSGNQTKLFADRSGNAGVKPPDHLAQRLLDNFHDAKKHLYDAKIILALKDKLALTAQQEQKIKDIIISYRETEIRQGAEIKIREMRLASYVQSSNINKEEMARYIREIGEQKAAWVVSFINCLLDINQVLTPQQLKILAKTNPESVDVD